MYMYIIYIYIYVDIISISTYCTLISKWVKLSLIAIKIM